MAKKNYERKEYDEFDYEDDSWVLQEQIRKLKLTNKRLYEDNKVLIRYKGRNKEERQNIDKIITKLKKDIEQKELVISNCKYSIEKYDRKIETLQKSETYLSVELKGARETIANMKQLGI